MGNQGDERRGRYDREARRWSPEQILRGCSSQSVHWRLGFRRLFHVERGGCPPGTVHLYGVRRTHGGDSWCSANSGVDLTF